MGEQIELDRSLSLQRTILENMVIGTGLTSTLDRLCELVEQITPDAVCSVMLVNDDGCSLSVGGGPSLTDEVRGSFNGLIISANAGSCGTAAYTGKPVIAEDTTTDARWANLQEAVERFNIRACWSYPITGVGGKETLGTFAISHRQPTKFEDHHRALLDTASHLAGIAIQLSRSDKELRDSESRFRRMADGLPEMLWLAGPNKECNYLNRSWLNFTGRTLEQELGNGWVEGVHPDDVQGCVDSYVSSFDARQPFSIEYRLRRHDGEYRWVRCSGVPWNGEDGTFAGYVGSSMDITERRQADDALIQITRDAVDENQTHLFNRIVTYIAETLGADYVIIGELQSLDPELVRTQAVYANGQIVDNMTYELAGTPCEDVILRGMCVHSHGVQGLYPDDKLLCELGVEGYMGIPLLDSSGNAMGVLVVLTCKPMPVAGHRKSVFKAFATRAAAELERVRAHKRLKETELRLGSVIDYAPVILFALDDHGRFTLSEGRGLELQGLEAGQLVGQSAFDFYRDEPDVIAAISQALAGEAAIASQTVNERTYETQYAPLTDNNGSSGVIGVAIDVTERIRAEQEADELDMAIKNAIPGISRLDENDCYVMVRDRYAEILGYTTEEMMGMHVSKTIHPDDMPISMAAFEKLYSEGRAESEVRGICKDGSTIDKRCLLVATHDDKGRQNGYYCFMDDITERKNAQREKQQLEEQLRQSQKLEAVGTLASGIAHDFNNLLTAINGYAEIARDSLPIGHPARRSMEMLENATEQASGVTRSLLTFSHRAQFEKERIDLAVVINDSIQLLRHLLPASIELVHEIEAVPPVWVNADATQIQQVLMNLAINARDAMENGGQVEIRLLVKHPGDICRATDRLFEREEAVIVVRDTGKGMTPETASRVFEPFFTTKQRGKGTGLGLSVVHGIVTDHDGMIGVESQPGLGTTFIVCLPTCESSAALDASRTKTPRVKPNGEMILLAEDNIHVGNLMVEALESAGYNPVLARDGDEAMNLFRKQCENARLVVLDVDLPKRSGLNCADEIRQANSDLPVVVVTGNVQQLKGRKLGDNEQLLAKPFRPSELIRVVNECLGSN